MFIERLFNVLSLQIERRFNKDYLIFIKYCSLYKEERPKKEKKQKDRKKEPKKDRKTK